MDNDYSVKALSSFVEQMKNRGDLTANTAKNWTSAVKLVLNDLTETEAKDVRSIDVEIAVRRYNNRAEQKLSGESLKTYVSRLKTALGEFIRYTDDPLNYKPKASTARTEKVSVPKRKSAVEVKHSAEQQNLPQSEDKTPVHQEAHTPAVTDLRLKKYNYDLRRDLEIPVVVPRDLTMRDVRRLTVFLESLVFEDQSDIQDNP